MYKKEESPIHFIWEQIKEWGIGIKPDEKATSGEHALYKINEMKFYLTIIFILIAFIFITNRSNINNIYDIIDKTGLINNVNGSYSLTPPINEFMR